MPRHHPTLVDREGLRLDDPPQGENDAEAGVTWRGAPLLSRYAWRWWSDTGTAVVDRHRVRDDGAGSEVDMTWRDANDRPTLQLHRGIEADGRGWSDRIVLSNPGDARRVVTLELGAAAAAPIAPEVVTDAGLRFVALGVTVRLTFDPLAAPRPDGADWELSLAPGETLVLFTCLELTPD